MTDQPQPRAEKQSHALDFALAGMALVLFGLTWYLQRRFKCPCDEHTTGEEPIIQVAKASADMARQPSADDPPEEPRSTAPGGNHLTLGEPAGFNPQPTELPKPDAPTSNGRRTRK